MDVCVWNFLTLSDWSSILKMHRELESREKERERIKEKKNLLLSFNSIHDSLYSTYAKILLKSKSIKHLSNTEEWCA